MRLFNKIMIGALSAVLAGGLIGITAGSFYISDNVKRNGVASWGIYLNENNLKYEMINISNEEQLITLFGGKDAIKNFASITNINHSDIQELKVTEGLITETNKYTVNFEVSLTSGQVFSNNGANHIKLINIPTGINYVNFDEASKFFEITSEGELVGLTESGLLQETLTIPNNVVSIGEGKSSTEGIFSGAKNLKEVILSQNTKQIKKYSFAGSSIKSIYIPPSVASIGYGAFENSSQLKDVVISEEANITNTGGASFRGTSIESITLPKKLKRFDDQAFGGIKTLKLVVILNDNPEFNANKKVFFNSGIPEGQSEFQTKFIVQNSTTKNNLKNQYYKNTTTIPEVNIVALDNSTANIIYYLETKILIGGGKDEKTL